MRKFNRTAHMALWLAIADKVRVTGIIPRISTVREEILHNLGFSGTEFPQYGHFACQYTLGSNICNKCRDCPLDGFDCTIGAKHELFVICRDYGGSCHKPKLMRFYEICIKIAMWPVKEGVVCE